ncbi:hypothetical protein SCLCIDRAFT_1209384 [Scleroderma citrinum Foug A]|uniref:Uncharacterized protein n=1 Tax=Scleroderma citrinum Foug A TaxID=1036808 RepID=A0A0C3A2X3_9AGAM|nr:hypothetical protein SCLCIDRAFT_1209384 [Scleroderma citrinum Foug A]
MRRLSVIPLSRSLPASCPCNIVKSLTFHHHIADKRPAGSSKTGSGAEAEDIQDLLAGVPHESR